MQSREFELSRPAILIIAANPSLGGPHGGEPGDAGKLALDQELADIRRELLLMAPHHDFELIWEEAVTVEYLMRLLIKFKPVAVHFAGHGVAGGRGMAGARCRDIQAIAGGAAAAGIVLLDEQRQPLVVTAEALAQMVASVTPRARLLVLNACHSETQAGVLSLVVDAVITMNGAIRDDSARSFAAAFYWALGQQHPVGDAFWHAKATLTGKGCPDEHLPRLRTRRGVRANDIVLARGPARWPTLDTSGLRERVRRQTRRGCLVAAAVAAAMIVAWATVATFVLADDDATTPRPRRNPPAGTPPAQRGRSEAEPEVLPPLPRSGMEGRGQPTGSAPQATALGAPPPAPAATDAPLPAPNATPAPGAPEASLPALPSSPRPARRPAPRTAAPATPMEPGAAPPRPVDPDAAFARPVDPSAAPAKPVGPDAAPAKPARLDDPGALGELDRETVRRYILRHHDPIRHCYEQRRMARPNLTGKVFARFDITPGGSVASATAIGLDSVVDNCVSDVIKGIGFPRSGTGVHVNYMFDFQPADARDAAQP